MTFVFGSKQQAVRRKFYMRLNIELSRYVRRFIDLLAAPPKEDEKRKKGKYVKKGDQINDEDDKKDKKGKGSREDKGRKRKSDRKTKKNKANKENVEMCAKGKSEEREISSSQAASSSAGDSVIIISAETSSDEDDERFVSDESELHEIVVESPQLRDSGRVIVPSIRISHGSVSGDRDERERIAFGKERKKKMHKKDSSSTETTETTCDVSQPSSARSSGGEPARLQPTFSARTNTLNLIQQRRRGSIAVAVQNPKQETSKETESLGQSLKMSWNNM